ncbi:hypothetical protein FQN50_006535 [Emmonsiellopsis sp. PD_5]|nr:hypothetical protein FQN50_006535 [Emmonsiellopsis sp. PD_5]
MAVCLLDILSEPNPTVDNTNSAKGTNTLNAAWTAVTGFRDWKDFSYGTLMSCYGEVLRRPLESQFPEASPPLTRLEREIWDENSLSHLLARAIIPTVGEALKRGWSLCYPCDNDPIEIRTGGVAKKTDNQDSRFYPVWAGIRSSVKQEADARRYLNLCPGEIKLSTKWSTTIPVPDFDQPVRQIQTYCGLLCGKRYGYIITQEELYVVRVSREEVDPGIAASRPRRARTTPEQPAHGRNMSMASKSSVISMDRETPSIYGHSRSPISSGMDVMSVSKSSSFQDDSSGIEYNPIEFKSIPWASSGHGVLTVKLALWWIHMLASAPEQDTSVKSWYPPLDGWEALGDGTYRHFSTGLIRERPSIGAIETSTQDADRQP